MRIVVALFLVEALDIGRCRLAGRDSSCRIFETPSPLDLLKPKLVECLANVVSYHVADAMNLSYLRLVAGIRGELLIYFQLGCKVKTGILKHISSARG